MATSHSSRSLASPVGEGTATQMSRLGKVSGEVYRLHHRLRRLGPKEALRLDRLLVELAFLVRVTSCAARLPGL